MAAIGAGYAVARGIIFVLLLLLIGTQSATALFARTMTDAAGVSSALRARIARLVPLLLACLAAMILIRGALQVFSYVDADDPLTRDMATGLLLHGGWGHAWTLQAACALMLAIWAGLERNRPPSARAIVITGIAVLLWAQSGMGHSHGENWHGPGGRMLDVAHVLGAGLWLGTLAWVLALALPALAGPHHVTTLARLVRAFSTYAKTGVVMIVISGITAALVYAGSVSTFIGSTWGRLLLIKVAGMAGVLGLGWYNWRVVTPALERSDLAAAHTLKRAVRVELLLGLVMLAITAMLVATALPGET